MQITSLRTRFEAMADFLRSPLLLVLRVYWGWQFVQAGWGKIMNLEKTAGFFRDLGIPAPQLNAILAGGTECIGGLLLLLGLWARMVSVPLIVTMAVAYATAEREALRSIASDPDKFTSAAPFLFLLVSLIVLAFGPGTFSVDRLLKRETNINNKA
ncbi:MAG: DoxX family protein [Nibricoccus sp.]